MRWIKTDHSFSLQNELQKSRDTAVDLHNLHNAMSEIHETLGGGNVSLPRCLFLEIKRS